MNTCSTEGPSTSQESLPRRQVLINVTGDDPDDEEQQEIFKQDEAFWKIVFDAFGQEPTGTSDPQSAATTGDVPAASRFSTTDDTLAKFIPPQRSATACPNAAKTILKYLPGAITSTLYEAESFAPTEVILLDQPTRHLLLAVLLSGALSRVWSSMDITINAHSDEDGNFGLAEGTQVSVADIRDLAKTLDLARTAVFTTNDEPFLPAVGVAGILKLSDEIPSDERFKETRLAAEYGRRRLVQLLGETALEKIQGELPDYPGLRADAVNMMQRIGKLNPVSFPKANGFYSTHAGGGACTVYIHGDVAVSFDTGHMAFFATNAWLLLRMSEVKKFVIIVSHIDCDHMNGAKVLLDYLSGDIRSYKVELIALYFNSPGSGHLSEGVRSVAKAKCVFKLVTENPDKFNILRTVHIPTSSDPTSSGFGNFDQKMKPLSIPTKVL
ncbi:uncharacterized protein SPPG_06031 [Spizellomyces punctatus DAOM BR117]|uniref:Metallo-beta-lactamase domain-containing protein n=1 Tax=Spizellomyces punctatus (strain DAOM BR117) TaxID=645134 RepID=A0A0L0HDQ2_SPIPD|nr:uncharacterized protein SPPG_06031 [Spizellomyces punctatus DAOM BR117]KNC99084.1 hypothetical protein SPPG_06031 [Spizellomyces punctatus DAOM BR117]|eukprot:XP_016607124.1 hypothetical protein SPPG_06031 [Spizellomyces punctatus DAOM BR117]